MNRPLLALVVYLIVILQVAFRPTSQPGSEIVNALSSDPALTTSSTSNLLQLTDSSTITITSQPNSKPDIPSLVEELYLGVSAGNGYQPSRVAVDSKRQRVYAMNVGFEDEGNTISILDTRAGEITALLRLNQNARYPRDVQIDPYRPRLYALWAGPSESEWQNSLTIVDTETLTVTKTITNVAVVAPGPDRLYLGNDTHLWAADPNSLTELGGRHWERQPNLYGPLLLNSKTNRLYLRQAEPGLLEIFTADTLEPVGSYSVKGRLHDLIIEPDSGQVVVLDTNQGQTFLRTLDLNGQPLQIPEPVLIEQDTYPSLLAFDGHSVYLTEHGQLHAFTLPDLTPEKTLSLPYYPNDLTIDPVTKRIYALYASSDKGRGHYILELDPANGTTKPIYTYLSIIDAITDLAAERLYLLDERGTVRVLRLSDYTELGQIETGFKAEDGHYVGHGHLSLDPKRSRLYIDGPQLRVVDTALLTVTHRLDEFVGRITPNPANDHLYYTSVNCGALILNADTFTGTELIFPTGLTEPPPPMSFCFYATQLDVVNQTLYGQSYPCAGGSSCGGNGFTSAFDVSGDSPRFLANIPGVPVAFDPVHQQAFASHRTAYNEIDVTRSELKGGTITETMQVFGVSFSEPSFYDSTNNRLYTNDAVFDSHLAMLAPINLPGSLVAFDPQRQRLYFSYRGNLLVAATSGGQLELPPPAEPDKEPYLTSKLLIASNGTRFRLDTFTSRGARTSRLYRSTDAGDTWKMLGRGLPGSPEISALAISPDFEQNQTLLAGMAQRYSGGGGISAGGLYRSTDSGNTWLPVTHGLTSTRIKEITFSLTFTRDQTVFLIVTKLNDEEELFHSNNGGRSWISLNIKFANFISYGTRFGLPALSPTFVEDGLVFITIGEVLLRSADGGNTWLDTKIPGELVAFSPNFKDDNLIVTGSHWRSTDRGQSWQKAMVGSEVGLSASSFFFSPNFASDETIYMLRKGPDYTYEFTLQRSTDAGRSWQNLVGGLPVGFEEATATFLSTGELQLNTIKGQEAKVTLETLDWDK